MSGGKIISILFFLLFTCGLTGVILLMGLGYLWGFDITTWQDTFDQSANFGQRQAARIILGTSNAITFLIPAALCAIIVKQKAWTHFLSFRSKIGISNGSLALILMVVSFPLVQYTYGMNQQLMSPEVIKAQEAMDTLLKNIIRAEYSGEFWFNGIIFALLPAIGEEFFFRGVLQQQLRRIFGEPQIAIWIAAFLFSLVHMQAAGFISRMLLGGLLGYAFFYTNNIWIPILMHFFNNVFMVTMVHLHLNGQIDFDVDTQSSYPWYWGITSLAVTVLVLFFFENKNPDWQQIIEKEEPTA